MSAPRLPIFSIIGAGYGYGWCAWFFNGKIIVAQIINRGITRGIDLNLIIIRLGLAAGDRPGVAAVICGGTADGTDVASVPVKLDAHVISRKVGRIPGDGMTGTGFPVLTAIRAGYRYGWRTGFFDREITITRIR